MSIRDVLRRTTHEPLFVEPAKWTEKHLRHLRCYFDQDDTIHHLEPADETHEELTRLARSLASDGRFIALLAYEHRPLIRSLSDSKFVFARRYSFQLPFRPYGIRPPGLEADGGWSGKPVLPTFGFTDYKLTQAVRRAAFFRGSRRRIPDAQWVCDVQARHAAPEDPFKDPLIVACLISMAQSQVAFVQENPSTNECSRTAKFSVKLFFSSTHDTDALRVYSAEVPAAFLAALDDPSAPMAGPLRVECRAIPYRPYETLYLRLWDEIKPLTPDERAGRLRRLHNFLDEQLRERNRIEKIVNGEIEEELEEDSDDEC